MKVIIFGGYNLLYSREAKTNKQILTPSKNKQTFKPNPTKPKNSVVGNAALQGKGGGPSSYIWVPIHSHLCINESEAGGISEIHG